MMMFLPLAFGTTLPRQDAALSFGLFTTTN